MWPRPHTTVPIGVPLGVPSTVIDRPESPEALALCAIARRVEEAVPVTGTD